MACWSHQHDPRFSPLDLVLASRGTVTVITPRRALVSCVARTTCAGPVRSRDVSARGGVSTRRPAAMPAVRRPAHGWDAPIGWDINPDRPCAHRTREALGFFINTTRKILCRKHHSPSQHKALLYVSNRDSLRAFRHILSHQSSRDPLIDARARRAQRQGRASPRSAVSELDL